MTYIIIPAEDMNITERTWKFWQKPKLPVEIMGNILFVHPANVDTLIDFLTSQGHTCATKTQTPKKPLPKNVIPISPRKKD